MRRWAGLGWWWGMVSRKVESEKRVEYGFREEIVYSRVKFNCLTPNRKTKLHLLSTRYVSNSSISVCLTNIEWTESVSCSVVLDSLQPMDCSLPGSSVHGILQARVLNWVAIPFSRRSSQPRDWTWVSPIAGRFFTVWATKIDCNPPNNGYFTNEETVLLMQSFLPRSHS